MEADYTAHSLTELTPSERAGTAEAIAAPAAPRVVRRVTCGYRLGCLPGDWLQTWRRLERVLQRAGFNVKATLAPLENLPEDTDVLVVPPELREAARRATAPGVHLLITSAASAPGAFADLVKRLEAGDDISAERLDPAGQQGPKIVRYRGSTCLD
jgi:hypothetical protein